LPDTVLALPVVLEAAAGVAGGQGCVVQGALAPQAVEGCFYGGFGVSLGEQRAPQLFRGHVAPGQDGHGSAPGAGFEVCWGGGAFVVVRLLR
jgi:hypothetical protein